MKALGAHLYTNFPSAPPPRISYHICCEVRQQTNSGNVRDQHGLSVPKASLI